MNKLRMGFLVVALLAVQGLFAGPVKVSKQESEKARAAVQAEMNKFSAAIMRKDWSAANRIIDANFDKSFVETGPGGRKTTLNQWKQQLQQNLQGTKKFNKFELKCLQARVMGNTLKTRESLKMDAVVVADPKSGKTGRLVYTCNMESVAKKQGGKWMAVRTNVLKEDLLINGKRPKTPQAAK